ncbi:MAG: prepilin-type N-terminal cleavage/methylation domain-containing protein [Candidatus Gastranaerophilales bacterium]|nr:prepilin-type N-terminal cleavage/methylation domain-containing protein [Candidatus Gastranaerophilales bacterium]
MKKNLGFTLAETLIVIAIVGIIASIATPMLFGTTSDAQLKAKWKKVYADLSQATQLLVVDNGGSLKMAYNNSTEFNNAFATKLNYIKLCISAYESDGGVAGGGATENGCFHHNKDIDYLDGTENLYSYAPITWPGLVLNNGTLIATSYKPDCSNGNIGYCAKLQVDINGFKGPNTFGKDVFLVAFMENYLIPYGVPGIYEEDYCEGSTGNYSGYGCAAKFLYE